MTVVYSFDFSEAATECAPAAAAVAARLGGPLLLAHVTDRTISSLPNELEAKLDAAIRARLDSVASQLRSSQPGLEVTAVTLQGNSVDELNAFAEKHAHLLILASPGHREERRRVGSVSERVAHHSSVPVLVMREPGPWLAWAAGRRPLRAVLAVSRDASCEGAIELVAQLRSAAPCDVVASEIHFLPEVAAHYDLEPAPHWLGQDPGLEYLLDRDLAKRISGLRGSGTVGIHPHRGVSRPADHLLDIAERERADVVVTGRHSPHAFRLGSLSEVLLHEGRMSMLVVPSPMTAGHLGGLPRLRRILAATDLSAFGNQAVRAAATLAQSVDGELHVFHAADAQVPSWDQEASLVAKLRQLLPEGWRFPVSTEVVFGRDPAAAIAGAAERIDADTICVASHVRGGIARMALGSVTEDLLRRTRRPVLVIRPTEA